MRKFESISFKSAFVTGIVILLPLALTVTILGFIFNFLTDPFTGVVSSLMKHYSPFPNGFFFLTQEQLIYYTSKFLVFLAVIGVTVALGILARWFFFNTLISFGESIVEKIPFINTIYKTSQDVIKTIFTSDTQSFKQVVLVPYPNKNTLAIGLVTKEDIGEHMGSPLVSVFVPTTPNPTSGFLMLFKKDELIYLDMSIENAIKYVISCGVISTPISALQKEGVALDKNT
jgi:Uncharacterized conserved protein